MLVNVPKSLKTNNLKLIRPVFIGNFEDGSGYVFNAQSPNGVKYLPAKTFAKYSNLIGEAGNPPVISAEHFTDNADFIKHGIAFSSDGALPVDRKKGTKALTVWFHVSNACNLACSYCYIPKLSKAVNLVEMNKHFMSSATAESAAESLFQFCVQNEFTHLQIKFAGGEPTLNHSLIIETCDHANMLSERYGIKVGFRILTNGVFINDGIFKVFEKYKFGVSISVDGDEQRHNEVRFTIPRSRVNDTSKELKEGTWSQISENIDRLIAQGIKPYILCTITQRNYKDLFNLVEYCQEKQIGFRLSPVRDKSSHLKEGLENDILAEMIKIYDWIGDNLPYSMPVERFARFAEWNLAVPKQTVCGTCKSTMSIDQNGQVASCQMRMDKPFGNIKNENLTEIFGKILDSDDYKYIVQPNSKTEDCSICYWKYTCAGGCPEHTRIAMGTLNSPSPWCHLYQDLLPYYIRAIAKQIKRAIDT